MQNISSINHANFARLHELTNNYNKATLLDKLIFWWQISTYTLDDGHIWFTRCLNQIAEESKISKRSVERYLHDFEVAGFIEKTNKLYKKKNLYIRITDKLLVLLGTTIHKKAPQLTEQPKKDDTTPQKTPSSGSFLTHFGGTDSANLAVSIYKEKDSNSVSNNTVSHPCIVDNVKTTPLSTPNPNYPSYAIEQQIGERITERLKNYIKGTMRNLQTQHQLSFSNPEQLFAEIVFSVLQVDNQLTGVFDTHHRVNLIAKLLRQKQWRTPKGFYNHWDVGQTYKNKIEQDEYVRKQAEPSEYPAYNNAMKGGARPNNVTPAVHHHQLQAKLKPLLSEHRETLSLIATETRYLTNMEERLMKKPDNMTQCVVDSTAIKLARLHEKASILYQQIEAIQEAA